MVLSLAVMGIYFIKSTDLPKELTDMSAKRSKEPLAENRPNKVKMSFDRPVLETPEKFVVRNLEKKLEELKLLNEESNRLTFEITTLEQEIKVNNLKNQEIQALIDIKLATLETLHSKIKLLA
jgi:hypothetical protein